MLRLRQQPLGSLDSMLASQACRLGRGPCTPEMLARYERHAQFDRKDGMSGLGLAPSLYGRPQAQQGQRGESYYLREYDGVDMTIEDMRRMVKDALQREQSVPLRKLVDEVVSQVEPKDYLSEIAAVYYYVLKNVRYARDPRHVEYVQHPNVLLQPNAWDRAAGRRAGSDDCEAISTTLAAMLMVIGNACEFVTISTVPGQGFHHVFCVTTTGDGQRVVIDPIPGPHTSRMLASIVKHQAWPVEPVRYPGKLGKGWGTFGTPPLNGLGRAERVQAAAARHDVCRTVNWGVSGVPKSEWVGPCIAGQNPLYLGAP